MKYLAFLSYAHRYKAWVQAFQQDLEACLVHHHAAPHQIFLDSVDLGSGRSWVTQLQEGVAQARHLILVVTPEAMASPRVEDEWGSFLSRRRDWLKGHLHLVRLVETPLPPFLGQLHYLDFTGHDRKKYEAGLQLLVGALLGKSAREARKLDLPASLGAPTVPTTALDPKLRSALIEWLSPRLVNKRDRKAICAELGLQPGRVDGYPTWELAASALLVEAQGADAPAAAALRVSQSLIELYEEDGPEVVQPLREVVGSLEAAQRKSPEDGLLSTYLQQLATDHESLVPYFQQEAEMDMLDRVYVRLSLRLGREPEALVAEGEKAGTARPGSEPLGISEVLELGTDQPGVTGRWVILGDPGAGKTTLVRHLAARLARQTDRPSGPDLVPLLDSLPRMMREQGFLLDRIARRLRRAGHEADALPAVLEREAREGRLLLLLDGLDEVPKDDRGEAEALLRDLSARWPETPIVVTSRPIGYRKPGSDYRELELLPLDEERRRDFLVRWFGRGGHAAEPSRVRDALALLQGDPALWELSGNPLYLTLMALLLEEGASPDRHRPRLYDQVFHLLLTGKHKPEPQPMEHPEAVRGMLRHLGFGMTGENLDVSPRDSLVSRLYEPEADDYRESLERVPRWRRGMDAFLEDLGTRTGILGPHDGPDTDWRFWHRTFREALAAEELALRWKTGGEPEVLAHAKTIAGDESRWAEPYALLVGQVEEPDSLVRALVTENPDLGLRALATAQGLQEETITEVLQLVTDDIEERGTAILRIPELLGEAERACHLLDSLRRRTRDGNDLFFLHEALAEVERLYPEDAREAERVRGRFFDHIPAPPDGLFHWVETPKDGRVPLWREIPAGENWMGSSEGEGDDDEHPRHRVRVLEPFAMASVPITNVQYATFDLTKPPQTWNGVSDEELAAHPRVNVSWYEVVSFCRWLSLHLPGARLPAEAEWEYACRAGKETRYWSGDDDGDLARVGWYRENSERRTHRVGEKEASPWGLYDIHGNVREWTASAWPSDYSEHASGREIDPRKPPPMPPRGGLRVMRGGSCWDDAGWARAAYRYIGFPGNRDVSLGFRVVLPAVPEP